MRVSYDDYLAHHGILGMHWGKRNGPPYPLGSGDHSSEERTAAKRGYSESSKENGYKSDGSSKNVVSPRNEKSSGHFHLTDGQKKAIAIGAGVAVTALAAYGGYRLYKSGILPVNKNSIDLSPEKQSDLNDFLKSETIDFDQAIPRTHSHIVQDFEGIDTTHPFSSTIADNGFLKKEGNWDIVDDFRAVNPGYSPDKTYLSNNCSFCSSAFLMRVKGYDVVANMSENGRYNEDIVKFWNSAKLTPVSDSVSSLKQFKEGSEDWKFEHDRLESLLRLDNGGDINADAKAIVNRLKKEPNTYGYLNVAWRLGGGHSMVYDVDEHGEVSLFDAQTGKVYDTAQKVTILLRNTVALDTNIIRVDNLSPNAERISEAVSNRGAGRKNSRAMYSSARYANDTRKAVLEYFRSDKGKRYIESYADQIYGKTTSELTSEQLKAIKGRIYTNWLKEVGDI